LQSTKAVTANGNARFLWNQQVEDGSRHGIGIAQRGTSR